MLVTCYIVAQLRVRAFVTQGNHFILRTHSLFKCDAMF